MRLPNAFVKAGIGHPDGNGSVFFSLPDAVRVYQACIGNETNPATLSGAVSPNSFSVGVAFAGLEMGCPSDQVVTGWRYRPPPETRTTREWLPAGSAVCNRLDTYPELAGFRFDNLPWSGKS